MLVAMQAPFVAPILVMVQVAHAVQLETQLGLTMDLVVLQQRWTVVASLMRLRYSMLLMALVLLRVLMRLRYSMLLMALVFLRVLMLLIWLIILIKMAIWE